MKEKYRFSTAIKFNEIALPLAVLITNYIARLVIDVSFLFFHVKLEFNKKK